MYRIIDLSHVIENNMPVYPGDTRTSLFQTNYFSNSKYNNFRLETCMHSGTHIDSPMHMTESNVCISEQPLEAFIAEGCVLDVRNQKVITMKPEYEQLVKECSIVLLYTGYDKHYGTEAYYQKHPVVADDFGRFLIHRKVKMLGVDMPSPDLYPFEIHKMLLNSKVYIIENLTNLDKLPDTESFEVIALPLKINADSSMARVVARTLQAK